MHSGLDGRTRSESISGFRACRPIDPTSKYAIDRERPLRWSRLLARSFVGCLASIDTPQAPIGRRPKDGRTDTARKTKLANTRNGSNIVALKNPSVF